MSATAAPKPAPTEPQDYSDCCRACLGHGEMRPLYGACLDSMLMTVADIQVEQGDGLPEMLCVQCVLQVSRTFTFKKLCQRSDVTLWQWFLQLGATAEADPVVPVKLEEVAKEPSTAPFVAPPVATRLEPAPASDPLHSADFPEPDATSLELPLLDVADTQMILRDEDCEAIEQHLQRHLSMSAETETDIGAIDTMAVSDEFITDGFQPYGDEDDDEDDVDYADAEAGDASDFLVSVDPALFDTGDAEDDDEEDDDGPGEEPAATEDEAPTTSASTSSGHLQCSSCPKHFADPKVYRRHLKIHSANKPHVCPICSATFAESSNLTKHKKKHTGELRNVVGKPNLCSVCGKRFKWASSLSKHMKHHTKHKILTCPYCPKYYVEARSLNIHIRGHTGEKPFRCDVCQKGFTQMGNLDKHMRVHTGEKPYRCPMCGKGFSQSGYVAIHVRTHTGERPYECGDCGKGFAGSNTLAIHMRTHTGERPYKCGICSKRFARQETAVIHQRTHTGEKPHVCGVCGRGFTSSGHLTGHMRSHSGEKPHGCAACGKRFAGSGSLKVHMRSHEVVNGGAELPDEVVEVFDGRFGDLAPMEGGEVSGSTFEQGFGELDAADLTLDNVVVQLMDDGNVI